MKDDSNKNIHVKPTRSRIESENACPLHNRRQFLKRAGMATGGVMAWNSGLMSLIHQQTFLCSVREVMGKTLIPGEGVEKPRIAVAFVRPDIERFYVAPGAGFPLAENQQLYTEILTRAGKTLDLSLDIEQAPLKDIAATDTFLREKASRADGALLVHMATRENPEISHFLERRPNQLPTVIYGPLGTRTWMIREAPRCFIGITENVEWLGSALRMLKAQWQMSQTRLAIITGDQERREKLASLGAELHYMPLAWLREAMLEAEGSKEAQEIAAFCIQKAAEIVEPSEYEILQAARNYVANRRLMQQTGTHAVTTDCLGLVREGDGTQVQCLAYCMLLDEGTCGGCEADVYPALTCLLSSYLLGKPGFMANASLHSVTNEYVGFHCQTPTRMDGFDQPAHAYKIRPHHETQQGVTMQIDFRAGQTATLWRFMDDQKMGLETGTISRSVRPDHHHDGIGGCQNGYALVVDRIGDIRNVRVHTHPVLTYGNHRHAIRAWTELAGLTMETLL